METTSPSDIEALAGEEGGEKTAESPPESKESGHTDQDTQKSPEGQEPVAKAEPVPRDPGNPKTWGKFYPQNERKPKETLEENVEERIKMLNQMMADKELLILAKVDQNIHQSYYKMWVSQANEMFRAIVRTRQNLLKKTK